MKRLITTLLIIFTIIFSLVLSTITYYKRARRDSGRQLVLSDIIKSPVLYDKGINIPDENKIILRVGNIDTRQEDPMIPKLSKLDDDTIVYILVQVDNPVKNESYEIVKGKLKSLNAKDLGYVPNYAYIVKAKAGTIKDIVNIKGVKWVGWFYPEYKTDLTDNDIKDNMINISLFYDKDIQDTINKLDEIGYSETGYFCHDGSIPYCVYKKYKLKPNHNISEIIKLNNVAYVELYVEPTLNQLQ